MRAARYLLLLLLIPVFGLSFSKPKKKVIPAPNTQFQHPPGKYISVNGAKLWIEISGKGDTLILLSGGPGENHVYMHSFDVLKDSNTLVFVDAFGRGKSDTGVTPLEYSIERDVEDLEGIRKALGIEHFNVLGHSYGSVTAQLYALKYGEHLKHLIIANGFYNGAMWQENDDNSNRIFYENDPEAWDSLMVLRSKGYYSSSPEHYTFYSSAFHNGLLYMYNPDNYRNFPEDTSYPNLFNYHVYYQILGPDGDFRVGNEMARFDVTERLKELKMPVLIIAGRYDRVSVPVLSVQYKKYCPQATFLMIEHGGHNPQVEAPEEEFPLIRKFLRH